MIRQIPMLDAAECASVVTRLRALRDRWIDRSLCRRGTFFTLGRAAYLDVCLPDVDAETNYYAALQASNASLLSAFPDIFDCVRGVLADHLGAPVTFASHLAVPGFHVFVHRGIVLAGECRPHFDVQYSLLRVGGEMDPCAPISFTIPLVNPVHGTGLETWNVSEADYQRAVDRGLARSLEEYAARKVMAYYAYTPGVLVLHEGLVLHRLASPGPIEPSDERISFQGHGIRIGGEWMLYW